MHNSWLVILSENGVLGSLFYLAFFAVSVCRIREISCAEPHLIRTCVSLLVMLGVNGFSESFLFSAGNVMSLPFWMSFWCLEKLREVQA